MDLSSGAARVDDDDAVDDVAGLRAAHVDGIEGVAHRRLEDLAVGETEGDAAALLPEGDEGGVRAVAAIAGRKRPLNLVRRQRGWRRRGRR